MPLVLPSQPRRPPQPPQPPPARHLDQRVERVVARALHGGEVGFDQGDGEEGGPRRRGDGAAGGRVGREVAAGQGPEVGAGAHEAGAAAARHHVLAGDAVGLEDVGREIDLSAAGVPRQGPQQAGDAVGHARMAGRRRAAGLGPVAQDEAAEADEGRGGLAAIALEVVHPGHRVVVEVEDPGIDEVDEGLAPELALDDGVVQGGGHGVGLDVAAGLAL